MAGALEWGLSEQRAHLGRFRPVSSKDTNSDYYESFDSGEDEHEYLINVNRKDGNEDNVEVRFGATEMSRRRRRGAARHSAVEDEYECALRSSSAILRRHGRQVSLLPDSIAPAHLSGVIPKGCSASRITFE